MVAATPLDHALDALVELETGHNPDSSPKTQQMSRFDAETTTNAIAIEPARPKRQTRRRNKTDEIRDYGSGLLELNKLYRKPMTYKELDTAKKIGYLAHKAHSNIMNSFIQKEKSNFLKSGMKFSEWYATKKSELESDYAKWRKLYGWIPGWWNPNPIGDEPEDLEQELRYLHLMEKK